MRAYRRSRATGLPIQAERLKQRSQDAYRSGFLDAVEPLYRDAIRASVPAEVYHQLKEHSLDGTLRNADPRCFDTTRNFTTVFNGLDAPSLHLLYSYYNLFGSYITAAQLFEPTINAALSCDHARPNSPLSLSLRAACAAGEPSYLQQLSISSRKKLLSSPSYQIIRDYLALLSSNENAGLPWLFSIHPFTDALADRIQGQSLWLIGPLTDMRQDFADEHDVVIKLNVAPNHDLSADHYHGAADVVFANSEFLRTPDGNTLLREKGDRTLVIHRDARLKSTATENTQFAPRPNDALLNGHCNMVQWAVFSVLLRQPKSLYISGFPLFARETLYKNNHYSANKPRAQTCRTLRGHDLLANFAFLKNLFQAGFFSADDQTLNALNNDITNYADNINAVAGQFYRDSTDHQPH